MSQGTLEACDVVYLEQRMASGPGEAGGSAGVRFRGGRRGGASRRSRERRLTCRAPMPPLDVLFDVWHAGDVFHVIHDTAYAPESFNPGVTDTGALRNPTRFAPVRDAAGKVVPYLYGGSSLDCAIFETIFHNVPVDAPDKFVDLDGCAQRGHGQVVPARDLKLADLTTDGLHRLKVSKAELIGSAPTDYLQTALCAQAIHHQYPDADGLLRVSRQPDRDRALMVFGDRVDESLSGQPRWRRPESQRCAAAVDPWHCTVGRH